MNILVNVTGSGVSMCEVNGSQASGLPFVHENRPGASLRDIICRYWGGDNTLVVFDGEFGTGYHGIDTHGSMHGFAGYRLVPLVSLEEMEPLHNSGKSALAEAVAREHSRHARRIAG